MLQCEIFCVQHMHQRSCNVRLCVTFATATLQGEIFVCRICYSDVAMLASLTHLLQQRYKVRLCTTFSWDYEPHFLPNYYNETVCSICNTNVAMWDFICLAYMRHCNVRLCAQSAITKLQFEIVCPICFREWDRVSHLLQRLFNVSLWASFATAALQSEIVCPICYNKVTMWDCMPPLLHRDHCVIMNSIPHCFYVVNSARFIFAGGYSMRLCDAFSTAKFMFTELLF
jgi:hypothetical protein